MELTESLLGSIKAIEIKAYPPILCGFQSCSTVQDALNYCGALSIEDLLIILEPNWYFIAVISTGEIVDFASDKALTYNTLLKIKRALPATFKGRHIFFDALDSTSNRITRRFSNIGEIVENTPFLKKGIPFHRIKVSLFY